MYPIISRYAAYYAATGVSESSSSQCEEKLNRLFDRLTKEHGVVMTPSAIENLTPQALTDLYINMAQSGRSMATRNNYVCFLNPFLRWAYRNEYVTKDLSTVLKTHRLPREDEIPEFERKQKHLTRDQGAALLASINGRNAVRDRAIVAMFLYSGLRTSELCSLTLASVLDQPQGLIYVKRKGGSWKHTEIGEKAFHHLHAYLHTRNDLDDHSRPLFLTDQGNPCTRKQIYKMLANRQRKLGLPTGAHSLRHSFVSNVSNHSGAPIARDLANHRSLIITNRYAHSTPEERMQAVNKLDWE